MQVCSRFWQPSSSFAEIGGMSSADGCPGPGDPIRSSEDAPPTISANVAPDGKATLTVVPHEGFLSLDQLPGQSIITHSLPLERVCLTPEGWELIFDEEGFAAAGPPSGASDLEPVVLEDRLQFVLLQDPDGAYVIGGQDGVDQYLRLDALMQRWEHRELKIKFGVSRTLKSFDGALFRWPKHPNARYFWSARSIYQNLGFDQFGGQQWRWVGASWRRWKSGLEKDLGLGEHIQPTGLMKELVCLLGPSFLV